MGAVLDQATTAFDDYNTHAVPASGIKQVQKPQVREAFRLIDAGRMWSVTDYGVVGDANQAGTSGTNNTTNLKAAFDSGKSLFFPPGNYLFSADNLKVATKGQVIMGSGREQTRLICSSSTGRAVYVQGVEWAAMNQMTIKFADAVARSSGQKTLSLESSDNCNFSHVRLDYGLINLDIESCIDIGFDTMNILAGSLAIRIAATLSTYGHACNKLDFRRVESEGHTAGMLRVDQSGTENISAISMEDCRTEEDGTVSSGNYIIDMNGMVNNGATYGARIVGLHAEGLKQVLLRFAGPSGCTNAFRTFSMRDSTLITGGASAYTNTLIGTINNAKVKVDNVNAGGAGATHTFDFGHYTSGECLNSTNIFNTSCTKDGSSTVDLT